MTVHGILHEVPIRPSTHERCFGGELVLEELPLDSLLTLDQIRGTANPCFDELYDSIDTSGLDNPPNVTRVSEAELAEYLDFTNATWGNTITVADLTGYRQSDGRYNLVTAGMTRTAVMKAIAANHTLQTGEPTNYSVVCKLSGDTSVAGIVATQARENLHSAPPLERTAIALVELYLSGAGTHWGAPEEFRAAQGGNLTKRQMYDAMAFAGLAAPVRQMVFQGYVPYAAGVELGKLVPVARQKFACEAGLASAELSGTDDAELNEAIDLHVLTIAAHISNNRLNSTAGARYVRARCRQLQEYLAAYHAEADATDAAAPSQASLFTMVSASQQAATLRRRERRELQRLMEEACRRPLDRASRLIELLALAGRPDEVSGVVSDTLAATVRLTRLAGWTASERVLRVVE